MATPQMTPADREVFQRKYFELRERSAETDRRIDHTMTLLRADLARLREPVHKRLIRSVRDRFSH